MNPVVDYIRDNASWIFSGLGVSLLTGLWVLIRARFTKRTATQKQRIGSGAVGIQAGRDVKLGTDTRETK